MDGCGPASLPPYAAVVLCGGRSRRMGGQDKTAMEIGGVSLLERVLAAVQDAEQLVIVGPQRPVRGREVLWTREEPPGGGPVAGLGRALEFITSPVCTVFAGDLPFAAGLAGALRELLQRSGADAVVPVDEAGKEQPLAAAYRTEELRGALHAVADSHGTPGAPSGGQGRGDAGGRGDQGGVCRPGRLHGVAVRDVLVRLRVEHVGPDVLPAAALRDVDTPQDLLTVRRAGHGSHASVSPVE